MKTIVSILILSLLIGCDNNNSNSDQTGQSTSPSNNISLPGTWRYTQVNRYFNQQTDEYLYTDYFESTMVFTNDADRIRYSDCWEYRNQGAIAIQTNDYLYLNGGNTAFARTNVGSYTTEEETNITYPGMTEVYFNQHSELVKINDEVNVDSGTLILTGNISIAEYDHTCLWVRYSDTFDRKDYELIVPYDDFNLSLRLDFEATPTIGTYDYSMFTDSLPIILFDVGSNATLFWDTVNSNTLAPDPAIINITESSNSTLSGTFSFAGQDGGNYSGEFVMDLATLQHQ